jgi:hypothetical protein
MKTKRIFVLVGMALAIVSCEYSSLSRNLTLYNQPLAIIKSNIQGKWKLQSVKGGFCGTCGGTPTNNSYMTINNDNIIFGSDLGVVVDTNIVWRRAKDIFSDSTFLLSYSYSKGYAFPYYKIVDSIQNGTLLIIDDAYDPLYYYYVTFQ